MASEETLIGTEAPAAASGEQAPDPAAATPTPAAAAPAPAPAAAPAPAPAAAPAAAPAGDAPKDAPAGAPEKYEDFKSAEGVALDPAVMGQFSEVAKELNLPQDKAQMVLDKMLPKMQARQGEQVKEFYSDIGGTPDGWVAAAQADKEFGGDKLKENLALAVKARDAFGSPELTKLLNKTGLGNHPEIIRAFYRAGKAIGEDRLVVGGGNAQAHEGDARRLYSASHMNP